MHDPLQDLARELKAERCPDAVSERVAGRIAGARASRHPSRWPFPSRLHWALAGAGLVVVLGFGTMWHRPSPGLATPSPAHLTASRQALVREQTQGALLAIGRILIDAGAHTGSTLRDEALPPLIDSFHSAKTKLTDTL